MRGPTREETTGERQAFLAEAVATAERILDATKPQDWPAYDIVLAAVGRACQAADKG